MALMALIGRLHPLLVHFPIALVIVAALAESAAVVTRDQRWRVVAIANVRLAAAFAVLTVAAGWRLALAPGFEATPLLEWHRWLGISGAIATLAAAGTTLGAADRTSRGLWRYRVALFGAAAFVAAAGHLGGLLVWGQEFLQL
jgi:uncharacterized membrane protein